MDKFNFIYDGKHHPNYRVEYEAIGGAPSISSPALFKSDNEAIDAALKESPFWISSGMNVIIVLKYTRKGLKEIFRKIA